MEGLIGNEMIFLVVFLLLLIFFLLLAVTSNKKFLYLLLKNIKTYTNHIKNHLSTNGTLNIGFLLLV